MTQNNPPQHNGAALPKSNVPTLERSAEMARAAAVAIWDRKGFNVVAMRVLELAQYTDYLIVASATSDRHAIAIADNVEDHLQKTLGEKPISVEGRTWGRWVLLDYGNLVVHIFQRPVREYYQLERLYADAPRLHLEEPKWVAEVSPDQLIEESFDYAGELWSTAALPEGAVDSMDDEESADDSPASDASLADDFDDDRA
ncbi:MAG: ribosome silencing factor [Deltaproteobacteria bacterium]|nr:ribosome silencing factor [Deltaproteobacteria bacterium]